MKLETIFSNYEQLYIQNIIAFAFALTFTKVWLVRLSRILRNNNWISVLVASASSERSDVSRQSLCFSYTQSLEVEESSEQHLDLFSIWICQSWRLKEAFVRM